MSDGSSGELRALPAEIDRCPRRRELRAFRFDEPGASLSFSARLAREQRWPRSYARRVVAEYRRFLYLLATAGHPCTPSAEVDQAWHLHLVYTRSYWDELCGRVLGRALHHDPTRGGAQERSKFTTWYEQTLSSYARIFGHTPPADIWPPASVRFGRIAHRTGGAWRERSRQLASSASSAPLGLLVLLAAALLAGARLPSDASLELETGDFLLLVVILCVALVAVQMLALAHLERRAANEPAPVRGTPLGYAALGYLRAGRPRAVAAVVHQLVEEGVLEHRKQGLHGWSLHATATRPRADASALERAIAQAAEGGASARALAADAHVRAALDELGRELERDGWIPAVPRELGTRLAFAGGWALLLVFVLARIAQVQARSEPVGLLAVLALIALAGALVTIGRAFVPRAHPRVRGVLSQRAAGLARRRSAEDPSLAQGAHAGLAVALLGAAALEPGDPPLAPNTGPSVRASALARRAQRREDGRMKCIVAAASLALVVPALAPPVASALQDPEPAPVPASPPEPPPEIAPRRGVTRATDAAFPGYTLLAPLRSTSTYLIDMQGAVVHEWKSGRTPGNSVYLLDDGSLLRTERAEDDTVFRGGGQGGWVKCIAWDGEVLWELDWSSAEHLHHHDIAPLPNGNVILIAWEQKSREQAIAAGRDPEQLGETGLWPDYLIEVKPVPPAGHEVVWEWHAWDHLVQDFDPAAANYADVTAHPELIDVNADHRRTPPLSAEERAREAERERQMKALGYTGDDEEEEEEEDVDGEDDAQEPEGGPPAGDAGDRDRRDRRRDPGGDWLHTNSVDYDPMSDLVIVSLRSLSEIWVIDHSTTTEQAAGHAGGRYGKGGDLLYRWGNPQHYGAGGPDARRLFVQHDASWIHAPGSEELRVLVFNNGEGRPDGSRSTVDELVLPFDARAGFARAPGAAFGPAGPAWSYGAQEDQRFFCSFISGAQRLPNGNTLVCKGTEGRVVEVTPLGEIAWDYESPLGGEAGERDGGPPPGGRFGPPREGRGEGGGPPGAPPRAGGPRDGRRGGPGGMTPHGLFRATRIAPDHPGLADRALAPR